MMYRMAMRATIALLLLAACWGAGPARPANRPLAFPIATFQLPNGVRGVVVPDPRAVEIEVAMRYQVGTSDDPAGREGTAHLAEHLAFLHRLDGRSLHAELGRITTRYDGQTEPDSTTFVARAAPEQLGRILAIEAARVSLPCTDIDDATFNRERAVVQSERRQRGTALTAIGQLYDGMYGDHPYHRFIYNDASLKAITAADACAFATAGYATDNAVLVVSGNVSAFEVERLARATLGALPRRSHATPPIAPAPVARRFTQQASIDTAIVAYGWPLPVDPVQRVRVAAVASILADHLTDDLAGDVVLLVLGGDRAPIVVVAIVLAPGDTVAAVRTAADRAIGKLPGSLGNTAYYDESFDHVHQVVLARFVAGLEDGNAAELRIADHVLAGRDPRATVAAELHALESLDRKTAIALARSALRLDRASTVVLEPDRSQRRGEPLRLEIVPHTEPPEPDDPSEAARAAAPLAVKSPLAGARMRTLPSGARVVLLPVGSLPSVEVRFVYAVGTGDEAADQPGIATLAALGLRPHAIDVPELVRFFEAGGTLAPTIGRDHTSFRTYGLERHLDVTLSAVARWLDAGHYSGLGHTIARIRAGERPDPHDAAADAAWRAALFGYNHAYARAPELGRLDEHAVQVFRAASYTTDRLTIIVAGGFDPAVASAWIDHTVGTQQPSPPRPRRSDPVTFAPVTLGIVDDTALLRVRMAIPVDTDRAKALVLAAMVDDAISDVRFQLAASYGLTARLEQTRLASWIEIDGFVDASRARDAMALIRDRIASLGSPGRFVRARRQVMQGLALVPTSARALADRAEEAAAMDRTVADDLATAEAVRTLTLAMLPSALDLTRAAVQLRGPRPAITAACAPIGRTPQVLDRT